MTSIHFRPTILLTNTVNFRKTQTQVLVSSVHFTGFKPPENDIWSWAPGYTLQSAFQSISMKNGGEEGDKHDNNTMKSNTLVL